MCYFDSMVLKYKFYKIAFALLTLFAPFVKVSGFNYCQLDCDGEEHTLCRYKPGGEECTQKDELLTTQEKKYILEFHNTKRLNLVNGRVQIGKNRLPSAGNMMKLVWDEELNRIAKRWADQCQAVAEHDTCRRTMDGQDPGQNIFFGKFPDPGILPSYTHKRRRSWIIQYILNNWFDERHNLKGTNYEHLKYDENWGNTSSKFIQMIWAQTSEMACGFSLFDDMLDDDNITFRFVCNYKVRGDKPGYALYRKGEPCSSCPPHATCSSSYNGLCWTGEPNDFGESRSNILVDMKILKCMSIILYTLFK